MAKPFLKWAGGKRQLMRELMETLPSVATNCTTYIEPFVGAGAVLFHLLGEEEYGGIKNYHIFDINVELILCYEALQHDSKLVYSELKKLIDAYPKTNEERANPKNPNGYYGIRNKWNSRLIETLDELSIIDRAKRVAKTIFLNRTCFNGLYRVNRKGEFNVPIGRYKEPSFPTERMLGEVELALKHVNIHLGSFESCEDLADEETLLYFDPPYRPLNKTSSFTSYTKEGFNDEDLANLFQLYKRLNEKGCVLMMSNSGKGGTPDQESIETMFQDFDIKDIKANRAINSKGNSRGVVSEVIVKNSLSNQEVITKLRKLIVKGKRYSPGELARLFFDNTKLDEIDMNPMPSDPESLPRYKRMVMNALRCSPDRPSHPIDSWEELKVDKELSKGKKYIYYIEIES